MALTQDEIRDVSNKTGTSQTVVQEIAAMAVVRHEQQKAAGSIESVHANAKDLVLSPLLYRDAYSKGMSFSEFLELEDKSGPYRDGLDAFERQLLVAGIRTRGDRKLGMYADKVNRFWDSDKSGSAVLFPEFIARTWRQVSVGPDIQNRFYMSSDPVSDVLNPTFMQEAVRAKQIQPQIPLSELVAVTTPIDSGTYEAFYLTDDATQYTMKRVGEGAEVPTAKLTGADHSIKVRKYGRRLLGSYEVFRRMRIDRFQLHIALLAAKAEADKVDTALDVIVNGDGNTSTSATNHNLTTLDTSAVANTLTLKGYLAWKMKWTGPYVCTTVVATEASCLQLLLLNIGSGNVPIYALPANYGAGLTPINSGLDGVRFGWNSTAPALTLVGIDKRFAVEMVTEIGSTLTETDKIISGQWNEIVMTEGVAFAIMDANCNFTLTISA